MISDSIADSWFLIADYEDKKSVAVVQFLLHVTISIWSFQCFDWAGDSNDAEEQPGPRVQELDGSKVNHNQQEEGPL